MSALEQVAVGMEAHEKTKACLWRADDGVRVDANSLGSVVGGMTVSDAKSASAETAAESAAESAATAAWSGRIENGRPGAWRGALDA